MSEECDLSTNTAEYLARYRRILSDMIRAMEAAPLTGSISGSFIAQMLPHHRAAIEMSENLLRYTTNLRLQRVAEGIIRTQTESIAAMERVRGSCARTVNSRESVARYRLRSGRAISAMFAGMEAARATNSIDCDFVREMIPHHEGAIKMSRAALAESLCPGLVPILRAIVADQSRGVRELREIGMGLRCF